MHCPYLLLLTSPSAMYGQSITPVGVMHLKQSFKSIAFGYIKKELGWFFFFYKKNLGAEAKLRVIDCLLYIKKHKKEFVRLYNRRQCIDTSRQNLWGQCKGKTFSAKPSIIHVIPFHLRTSKTAVLIDLPGRNP